MNRRSLLKTAIVAPIVGLGTAKAVGAEAIKVPWVNFTTQIGWITVRDVDHRFIVDKDFESFVESVRVVLESLLGVMVTATYNLRQHMIMEFKPYLPINNWMSIDETEFTGKYPTPERRRTFIERRMTTFLNQLNDDFDRCARVAKRLNLNK